MSSHIDVMSYLLTVLTFSVGFMSARRHAHFDVLRKDLADRSWKIRQALSTGQDLGPRDLAEDVAAVAEEKDSVVTFTRVVNAFLFLAVLVVFTAGVLARGPMEHGLLLAVVVLASATAVQVLGEYDVHWMTAKEGTLSAGTILGQLSTVDTALRAGHVARARAEVARIRDDYPRWVFARELAVFGELAEHPTTTVDAPTAAAGVDAATSLVELEVHHVAPLLIAEAHLRAGDPIRAIQEVGVVVKHDASSRLVAQLNDALRFTAGLPRWVLNVRPPLEVTKRPDGLDIGISSLPLTGDAATSLDQYLQDPDVDAWLRRWSRTTPARLTAFAIGALDDHGQRRLLLDAESERHLAGSLNTLGLICLARGMTAEALRVFEAAIRNRPNSSTSHWGRAIACHQRDWRDVASGSLRRALSLDPRNPVVLRLTQIALTEGLEGSDSQYLHHFTDGPSELERLQMALLGLRIESPSRAQGVQCEVIAALITVASSLPSQRSGAVRA